VLITSLSVAFSVVLGLAGLSMSWAADTLIWLQHDRYPEAWMADDCPHSLMMQMRGVEWSVRSWMVGFRCVGTWMFLTPTWAEGDRAARLRLRHLRATAVLGGGLLFAIVIVLMAILYERHG
jgi:hypothetical protein